MNATQKHRNIEANQNENKQVYKIINLFTWIKFNAMCERTNERTNSIRFETVLRTTHKHVNILDSDEFSVKMIAKYRQQIFVAIT